jgi:hypothetical protein
MGLIIGIEPGRKRDPAALCVVEREDRYSEALRDSEAHFLVRYLQRLPVGTSFPETARRLAEILSAMRKRFGTTPEVFVDATGLGQPFVDLLEAQARDLQVSAVYFSYGDHRTEELNGEVRLGKAWLVSRLQVLLQTGRLHLPRTTESELLAADLLDFEVEVAADANERFGAFRVSARDDLITALGLAVQRDWEPWLCL